MMVINRLPRQTHLEAMRGIAALAVVAHHFLLGFTPFTSGYLSEYRNSDSWAGNVFFAFINGTGAVFFFFVMSGYVLTHYYLQTGDKRVIFSGLLKRLPRLFLPVFISCLCAYLLLKYNLYYFKQAGEMTGSWWLSTLGFGKINPNFEPGLLKATTQSLSVFFNGVNHYNSALWTMRPELIGSILCMGLAYVLRDLFNLKYAFYLCLMLFLASARLDLYFYPFLFGLYIAVIQAKYPGFKIPRSISWLICAVGIYLLGYLEPINAYQWLAKYADSEHFRDHLYSVGGCFVLLAAVFCKDGYAFFAGKTGRLLGEISFPIYLIHTLVIGSISSLLYIKYFGTMEINTLLWILAAFTLMVSSLLAMLLAKIDSAWVTWLNQNVKKLIPAAVGENTSTQSST